MATFDTLSSGLSLELPDKEKIYDNFRISRSFGPIFSSPEPKAHKVSLKYTNGPSSVRRRPSSSTLSNLNISEASRPNLIKFYVWHHWSGGKAA